MPATNEQIHKNRNFTLHVKCKIRILITTSEYVYGKVNVGVELDFDKSEADSEGFCYAWYSTQLLYRGKCKFFYHHF